jgi:hypothetical protein
MQRLDQAKGGGGMKQVRHLVGDPAPLAPRQRLRQCPQSLCTLRRPVGQRAAQISLEACPGRLFQYGDMPLQRHFVVLAPLLPVGDVTGLTAPA